MEEVISYDLYAKKAFEISYALFRVAGGSSSSNFSHYLERYALDLLDTTVAGEYKKSLGVLRLIENFINLGAGVNLLSFQNAQLILSEAKAMNRKILEHIELEKKSDTTLEGVFGHSLAGHDQSADKQFEEGRDVLNPAIYDNPAKVEEYNALVAEYNTLLDTTKTLITTFNAEVKAFNTCLAL